MTKEKYFKDYLSNCLFKEEKIDFKIFYEEYKLFKKIGDDLTKKYPIKKISVYKDKIIIPNRFINTKIDTDKIFANFINANDNDNINSYVNLAILTNAISSFLKKYRYHKSGNKKSEELKLDKTIIELIDKISIDDLIKLIPEAINKYGKDNNYHINEKIRNILDTIKVEIYLDFDSKYSLYFHLLIVEIAFYTHKLYYNAKPTKICADCLKPHYDNSKFCKSCRDRHARIRRATNKKCKNLREKLNSYIEKNIVPIELQKLVIELVEGPHKNTDLNELENLCNIIENKKW